MTTLPQPIRTRLDAGGDLSALTWAGETDDTCLLLHGLGDCAWIWEPVIARWPGPRPRFIAPDLPGHGQSAPGTLKTSKSAAVAERLAPALADLDGPVWVAGHSAGAKVALGLLRRGAVVACGLSLVDAAGDPTPAARGRVTAHVALLRRGAGSLQRLVAAAMDSDPLADADVLARYFDRAGRAGGAGWHVPVGRGAEALLSSDIDMADALSQLSCPVQVIRGAFSSVCTAETATQLAAAAPHGGPVVTIDRAGHAIGMAQPGALAAALAAAIPG